MNIKLLFLIVLGVLFIQWNPLFGQTTFTSTGNGGGNWNTVAAWSQTGPVDADGIPDALDNVVIANNHTYILNNATPSFAAPSCLSLTLNGNGILNFPTNGVTLTVGSVGMVMDGTSQVTGASATQNLRVDGTFSVPATASNARISGVSVTINGASTIAGNFTLNNNTGTKIFAGAVTNTGTWTSTAITTTGNLIFRTGVSNAGIFAAAGATFNTNTPQSIGGSAAMSFSGIVTIAAGITVTNDNTSVLTLSSTAVALAVGGAGSTFTQGIGSTLSYGGSSIGVTTFNATAAGNTVIYTANAPAIRATNYYNLTHSGTGAVTVAGISIAGNLTESSTGTFNFTGTSTLNGTTATQTIGGTGTITFVDLTLASGTFNANVDRSISISGILNFTAANTRLLVVGNAANITLTAAASITNADADSYIQLDGNTGANSNLIRRTTNTVAPWQFTFPIGTLDGGYTPFTIPTITTAPTNNATLSVKVIYDLSVTGRMRRSFRLVVAGNNLNTTFSGGTFNYNDATDISSGDLEADYNTVLRSTGGGAYAGITGSILTASNQFTETGPILLRTGTYRFTIGAAITSLVWYSYQTGVFNNWEVWTLDPSGTTLDNPLQILPDQSDEITILNGFSVSYNVNNVSLSATTISAGGTLDMVATTGHSLGTVTGTGLLRVKGINLPSATYTDFVDPILGGTIEYYDVGGNLPITQTTYNKLLMTNSTGTNISYVLASDLTVNGTFNITASGSGTVTWQINDGTANQRTITLNGDLTLSANGRIRASNSGVTGPHLLAMYGNLTNNGSIKFFDDTDVQLADASYTSGAIYTNAIKNNAVNVTFTGATSKLITCNGQTDFYRLIMDKGTGQQAMLTINSTIAANFRLFGPNNQDYSGTVPNYISNNNLSIINGTLQLTGTITIPSLVVNGGGGLGGGWPIPQNGALWVNSSNVSITSTNTTDTGDNGRQIYVFGLLRMTAGTITTGYSRGILGGGSGSIVIEGGTINAWQLRTTYLGNNNRFAYNQSGGTVNVGTTGLTGPNVDQYPRFALPYAECSFIMSGGTLNVANPLTGGITTDGGILIFASTSNVQVTGGTVNAICPASAVNFRINSTAPFYNLNVSKVGAGASVALLSDISFDDGATFTRAAQPLTVLNNLTITTGNTPTFNCNANNLTVGGNLDVQASSTLTPGANIITLDGAGAQTWTNNGTISNLASVVLSKTAGTTLTLAGANTFPNITTALTLTSGTLADGGKTITVTGVLSNSATHSGSGAIVYSNVAASTIGGSNGTFGNLSITTNFVHALFGNQTITGNLRLIGASSTLNIGDNALTVLGDIYSDAALGIAFSSAKRILAIGLHNAGGLTRQGVAGDLLFPLGALAVGANPTVPYTPITINVAASTQGRITVRAVNSEHPVVTATGQSLVYYWRVTSSGYSGISSVAHKTYNYSTAVEAGSSANYRAARYDGSTFSWSYSTVTYNATIGAPQIPDFNTSATWSSPIGTQLDGEYTSGNQAAFGTVSVFYSRLAGPSPWNDSNSWSNASVGGAVVTPAGTTIPGTHFPGPNNPVVIGDGTISHTIAIDANSRSCGTLALNTNSTLDCSTFTTLSFGTNTGGVISGRGTLRIAAAVFPAGDFGNFIGASGGTVEWYGLAKTIPTAGPIPQNLVLDTYYNLVINPNAGQTITFPPTTSNLLTIFNDLTEGSIAAATGTVLTNGARTLAITRDLTITRGSFNFSNAAASATTLRVDGNISVATGATMTAVAGGTANVHTITSPGTITNNGTMNFRNTALVNLTLTGTNNVSFTGTGSGGTTLSLVTVNKGSSQTPTVTFDVAGTVTAATSGWLTLTNGTFNFGNSGPHTIVSTAATYNIPSTAKLKVSAGTVTILSNNSTTADLFLNGALEVAGGTVNVGNAANTIDNDIEYAEVGSPTINVSSGILNVNGSIRRATSATAGALVYNQTGGTVTVGGKASNNTRGVFEIDVNQGSSFSMSGGGSLTIQRPTGGTGYADVFINPFTSSVSANSTISVGLNGAAQTFRINIAPSVGNLTVLGGGSAQTVNMYSNPLVVKGSLTIQSPSILNTNPLANPTGFNVTVAGNMDILGTAIYLGGANTTTFNGTANQSAVLSNIPTAFNNLTIANTGGAGNNTVSFSGVSPDLHDLNILSGIMDVGGFALNVSGDITNNSSQIGSGSIVMSGAANDHNIFSNNGVFTNLTLLGSANKEVLVQGNSTINGVLNFGAADRYLTIGSNQLTLGASATITGAGSTAFIRTNGVETDLGVIKNWNAGAGLFTYEVGTLFAYTPVSFDLNVSSAGSLTVVPVNSAHLTSLTTAPQQQLLDYYWIVNAGLSATIATTHIYRYPAALITGSGGTLRAGYLDLSASTLGWTTTGHGGTATTTTMTFDNTAGNFPGSGKTFHYSVGTGISPTWTLPNPIVPVYSRLADVNVANPAVGGDWNVAGSWTLQADGLGAALASAPVGAPVLILPGARINAKGNGRKAFMTTNNGLLVIGDDSPVSSTIGHNHGIVNGTGTMRVISNVFPAGNYTSFVASGGGTIEYVAPMTMNSRSTYNSLGIFSGTSGTVTMTSNDLVLNGDLTIPTGTTLNNANNKNIAIAGNWSNVGTYTQGTGTVTFNGTAAQSMSGSTTFTGLTVNKPSGNLTLTGTGSTTITGTITLTSGHVVASSTNVLALGSSTLNGGSSSSFVAGPMTKTVASSFVAPLGSVSATTSPAERYRPATISNASGSDTWSFEYVGAQPAAGGFNDALLAPGLGTISQFEYWLINRAGATTADLTLSYNTGSYSGADILSLGGTLPNLRVARWDGAQWDLPPGGGTPSQSGTAVSGTISITGVTDFSPFTNASLDAPSALPIELISFTGKVVPMGVELQWKTATEINNDYFNVEKLVNNEKFVSIGKIKGKGTTTASSGYQFVDAYPSQGRSYYRLKQIDFDGKFTYSNVISIDYEGSDMVKISIYPNPAKGDEITLEIKGLKNVNTLPLSIIDPLGRQFLSANLQVDALTESVKRTISIKEMSDGMYILKIGTTTHQITRFIIAK